MSGLSKQRAPAILSFQKAVRLMNSVLNGKSQMPPWRGVLDMEQIDALWAYVRATVDR